MDIRAHQLDLFDAHLATQENRNGRLPHLRQQRNELVLLSFLPPELVTYILEYLIHDAITSDTLISFFDWTAATQIYGYWRNVALCAPLLWTRIRGQNLAWTRAFLESSKGLPLNVSLEQSGWEELRHDGRPRRWYDEFIGVVAGDMYRIKTLHIVLSDHDSWVLDSTLPSHLLSLTAPALRTLIITDDMDEYEWGDRSWFVRLIPACMPDLRDFRVRNMRPSTLDWLPCLYLPTVTSLTIHSDNCNDDDDDEDDICFVQSAVLSYCPNVGELMIFGNGTSGYEYPHRVLKLHKLDFLHAVKPSFDLLMGYDFSDTAFTRIVLEFPLN
ncbi:hypothetical protein AX16_007869 [Volvariella volvacea WC 439]|nr:hypothetical protein AX16_007869 [Volvariella volvacea WC 439]